LVLLGFCTRLAALPVVFAMGVAAFLVHGNDPLTMEEGFKLFFAKQAEMPSSKEPALLYFIPFLALVFTGPGRFSLDHVLWSKWRAARQGR
jgi:putative oxidoreductase